MEFDLNKDMTSILTLLNKYNKDFTVELQQANVQLNNNENNAKNILVFNEVHSNTAIKYVEIL